MAKKLNVDLSFTAKTDDAKRQIKLLQQELNALATGATLKINGVSQITPEIQKAMAAAGELQAKLESATNVDTGKLDLGKFTESLKKGKLRLQDYANQLSALGPAGHQAFTNLAQSIIQAEAPLMRCSQRLKEFGTTLANTARWQLSSSILHGFMSILSSANRYAQDLNKSLTDIRIVSGKSADEMAVFAEKANQAAKNLRTTTNEYSKASLIYFQQGDTEAEAMSKAAITTKMANVTGQSAEIVSNQLTAIWNNFNKSGDRAYEHFADILTKLGAETASSTDEIAGGLEKFAGIADQIGLSYEYAASALATITATSRESEEVVGTALKTIFARIQGLSLGETLDDGTDLNKYSEALASVGISIFDQNEQIKEMDAILDELANKWRVLSKDQQTALAQTVAGVRQYTQLVTLLDNWDFMEKNLSTAYNAEGELDKQAEVYAESWMAAQDKVTASAEAIYTKILDDDFIIGFLETLSAAIDQVGNLIDSLGGLKGVLFTIGSIVTQVFHDEMARGLRNAAYNVKQILPIGKKEQDKTKSSAVDALKNMQSEANTEFDKTENLALDHEAQMQEALYKNAKRISEENLKQLQIQSDIVRAMDKRAAAAARELDITKDQLEELKLQDRLKTKFDAQAKAQQNQQKKASVGWQIENLGKSKQSGPNKKLAEEAKQVALSEVSKRHGVTEGEVLKDYVNEMYAEMFNYINKQAEKLPEDIQKILDVNPIELDIEIKEEDIDKNIKSYQNQMISAGEFFARGQDLSRFSTEVSLDNLKNNSEYRNSVKQQLADKVKATKEEVAKLQQTFEDSDDSVKALTDLADKINTLQTKLDAAGDNAEKLKEILDELKGEESLGSDILDTSTIISSNTKGEFADGDIVDTSNAKDLFLKGSAIRTKELRLQNAKEDTVTALGNFNKEVKDSGGLIDWADSVGYVTSNVAALGSTITSAMGIIDVFNNPDATAWDKISAILTGLVGIIPTTTSLISSMTAATKKDTVANYANAASQAAKYWYIALIVAAIAALTAGIYAVVTAESEEEKALRLANEQLELSKNLYKDAKNAAAEFKNEISDYNDAINGLKSLELGTQEMTDAVEKANEKARELINTYGLFGKYSIGSFGEIVIDETAFKEVQDKLKKYEVQALKQQYSSFVSYEKANTQKKYEDNIKNFGTYSGMEKFYYIPEGKESKYFQNGLIYKYKDYQVQDSGQIEELNVGKMYDSDNKTVIYDKEGNVVDQNAKDFAIQEGYYSYKNNFSEKLTTKEVEQFVDAIDVFEEKFERLPADVDEFKKQIEEASEEYGIQDKFLKQLNNVLLPENFEALLELNEAADQAAEAILHYTEELVHQDTDSAYEKIIKETSKGDDTLKNLLNATKNTLVDIANPDLTQNRINKQDSFEEQVFSKTNTQRWADDVETGLANYIIKNFSDVLGDDTYTEWLQNNYKNIFEGTTQSHNTSAIGLKTKDMITAVLESQGYTITGTDFKTGRVSVSGKDASGEIISNLEFNNEQIQRMWAQQVFNYALQQETQNEALRSLSTQEFNKLVNPIIERGNEYGTDFSNSILAGIASGGEFNFSSLYGELSQAEVDKLNQMDGGQLAEMFLGTSDLETLKDLGFRSWDAFAESFKEGLDGWDPSIYRNALNKKYEALAQEAGVDVDFFKAYRKSAEARLGFEDDSGNQWAEKWLYTLEEDKVEDYAEALNHIGIVSAKLSVGTQDLSDNWEKWNEVMTAGEPSIDEINKIMPELNATLANILNWDIEDIEELPYDFAQKNWKIIQDVYNGVEGAQEKLAALASKEYLINLGIKENNKSFEEIFKWLNDIPDLEIGVSLDQTDVANVFNQLLTAGQMTVKDVEALLAGLGFKVQTSEGEDKTLGNDDRARVLKEGGYTQVNSDGTTTWIDINDANTLDKIIEDGKTKARFQTIDTGKTTYVGGGGLNTTSAAMLAELAGADISELIDNLDDIGERYKEINDQIEENNRLRTKNNTLIEQSYGEARFNKMRENLKLLKEEKTLLEQKTNDWANRYLIQDKNNLQKRASELGLNFEFNEDNNITNYSKMMEKLYSQRDAMLQSYGNKASAEEQEEFDAFNQKIQNLEIAISKYEETVDVIKDNEEQSLEKLLEIQNLNLDILNQELELKLSINEADLQLIEYKIGKISDDFYQMAEAAAYMATGKDGNKYSLYESNLAAQKKHYDQIINDYTTLDENGDPLINTAQFIEESKKAQSEIINNLNYLKDLDKTMMDYYGNTLSMSAEELAKHTKSMEQQISVLEHYANIMNILGKSQDYESLGVVLEAQAKTIGNEAKVAKEYYQMLSNQAAERKAEYEAAQANGMNQAGLDLLKKQWDEAEQAAAEAQDNMLAKTEEWAKAIKSAIENELNDLAQALENALTADFGGSFDALSNMMERANSLQEEYLTTTNQIYETNKMMRTAQQEIDKSTNSVAKRKLKSFIDETEQLQNQSKLSKYELEIQQAKYDLLLAEIALEEAQNAKSTVRLTRDSEGNFGYVYTADRGAVDDAAQKLEDAQNSLYNIGLEGANEYTEKYQQTLNEFYDTMTELQTQYLNGEFENELEYEHAMETARQYYYQKLQDYSSLYSVALTTDSRVVADAWSTDFQDMTYNTENWKNSIDSYVNEVKTVFGEWESQMEVISTDTIGSNLDNLKEKTNDIVTKNDELTKSITKKDGVIDALGAELTAVSGVTLEYANMRTTLQGLISDYETYLALINGNISNNGLTEEVIKSRILSGAWGKTEEEWYSKGAIEGANKDTIKTVIESLTEEELRKIKGEPYDEKTSIRNHILSGAWGKSRSEWINSGIADGFEANMINEIIKSLTEDEIRKIRGFDTGGYTGSWGGSYGKLALLHQKELVLNPTDTENFLTGMDTLNKIIQVIDLYSMNAQLGGLLTSPHYSDFGSQGVLEQQVHIEATFPNVSDSHEIEEALNTLVNRASQYANR